ncbi:MAG: hypothetical protein KCHDKBKB_02750 [Elusimicrobia bacterium]|nr:hypothetical protein [Elusimicrobiota bacterium]
MGSPVEFHINEKGEATLQIGEKILSLHKGEITDLAVDALVCPVNPSLDFSMGLAKIVSQAAGKELLKERPLAPEPLGKVVVMPGGKLKAKFIFLTVVVGEKNIDKLKFSIGQAIDRAIRYAEFLRLKSIAFPVLGDPRTKPSYDLVASEMIENVFKYFQRRNTKVKAIFFTAYNGKAFDALKKGARSLTE